MSRKLSLLVIFSCLLFFSSCQPDHDNDVAPAFNQRLAKLQRVSLEQEPELAATLSRYLTLTLRSSSTSKVLASSSVLNTKNILKVLQSDSANYTYTIGIANTVSPNSFSNLVLRQVDGGYLGFIMEYETDKPFNVNGYRQLKFDDFTGSVKRYSLDGQLLDTFHMQDGKLYQPPLRSAQVMGSTCLEEIEIEFICPKDSEYTSTATGFDFNASNCFDELKELVVTFKYALCENMEAESYYNTGTYIPNGPNETTYDPGNSTYYPGGGGYYPGGGGGGTGVVLPYLPTDSEMFEASINDSQLAPCMQPIMNNIKNLTQGVGQIVVNFAGNTPGFNWEVKDGALGGATGSTNPPANYNYSTGTVITTFDSKAWPNATDLSIARTMLHESVHAYLTAYFAINKPGWVASYPQMVQEWGTPQNWNDVHHEEFARSLVNDIAVALEEFGNSNGYNLSQQFYKDMAWAGLQGTTTFANLPAADRTRILDIIAIELTGRDTNGNNQIQKGKNAGC